MPISLRQVFLILLIWLVLPVVHRTEVGSVGVGILRVQTSTGRCRGRGCKDIEVRLPATLRQPVEATLQALLTGVALRAGVEGYELQ